MVLVGIFIILFFFVIARSYYRLAKRFHKNKALYTIAGLICYIVGMFGSSFILGFILGLMRSKSTWILDYVAILPIILGILACILWHKKLEKKWQREQIISESDILDDQVIT